MKSGENPDIQTMMWKLCHYLKLPVTLVFVFDGPSRPKIKRGTKVVTTPLWLIQHFERLVEVFGFYVHHVHPLWFP
jgi:Holliday junction resolvase YEN1